MTLSFSNPSTALIFGGLAFIFFSFVNVDKYQNGKISIKVPVGSKKYLIFLGIIIVVVGICLPMDDSEQQTGVPITINNTNILTQTITSEEIQNIPTILETSEKGYIDQSWRICQTVNYLPKSPKF